MRRSRALRRSRHPRNFSRESAHDPASRPTCCPSRYPSQPMSKPPPHPRRLCKGLAYRIAQSRSESHATRYSSLHGPDGPSSHPSRQSRVVLSRPPRPAQAGPVAAGRGIGTSRCGRRLTRVQPRTMKRDGHDKRGTATASAWETVRRTLRRTLKASNG